MAFLGYPAQGRCPRCGRVRGQRQNQSLNRQQAAVSAANTQSAENTARMQAARSCASGCNPMTISQELYTGTITEQPGIATCCDPYCGCREYPAGARNEFWPDFAHPRWLPCDSLYNGRRRR